MRALILLECLVVLALAGLIVTPTLPFSKGAGSQEPLVFPAARFLADAKPGETAAYTIDRGAGTLEFRVEKSDFGGPQGPPKFTIARVLHDRAGRELIEDEPRYVHLLAEHGLFPFMTPMAPKAFDRVWILRRIKRDEILWLGKKLPCWRIECIDPALDPEQESVVVWMHEDVPVYGILKWERGGQVYECTSFRPAG
jgi:hypothetical protein